MKFAISHPLRCLFFKCVPFFFIYISDNSYCLVWLLQPPLTCLPKGAIAPVHHAGVQTAECLKHLAKMSLLNESKTTKRDVSRKKLMLVLFLLISTKVTVIWSSYFFYNSVMHLFKK